MDMRGIFRASLPEALCTWAALLVAFYIRSLVEGSEIIRGLAFAGSLLVVDTLFLLALRVVRTVRATKPRRDQS